MTQTLADQRACITAPSSNELFWYWRRIIACGDDAGWAALPRFLREVIMKINNQPPNRVHELSRWNFSAVK